MVLPAIVFARVDLASATGGLAERGAVFGDELFVQAGELALAGAHSTAVDGESVASAGGVEPATACAVPAEVA